LSGHRPIDRGLGDDELARLAREGRAGAFEELVRRHRARVYRVALRMLGNRTDAEDATQDAFLKAWRALPRFRGESSFATWMYRVVVNQCLSSDRGRRPVVFLPDQVDPAPGPDDHTEGRARLAAFYRALATVTPEQRTVVVLRELEGLSYDEIAAVLDISVAAVKGRLHRARLELTAAMRAWS